MPRSGPRLQQSGLLSPGTTLPPTAPPRIAPRPGVFLEGRRLMGFVRVFPKARG